MGQGPRARFSVARRWRAFHSIVTGWSTGTPFISVSLCVRVSSPPARKVCSVNAVASVSIASRAALEAT